MRVLMVCLGNICRSPMAEAVLCSMAPTWSIDSAGTGAWHVGHPPDPRTLTVLQRHGLSTRHRGRQVTVEDFSAFDIIFAMDRSNLLNLGLIMPTSGVVHAAVRLLGAYDPLGESEIPDPYHDELPEFEAVFTQVERCCREFVRHAERSGSSLPG